MQAQFKSRSTKLALAAALVALCGVSSSAVAATTGDLGVSAAVVASCTLTVPTALAFGDYDPIVTNKTADLTESTAGEIDTTCSNGAAPSLTLSAGGSGVATARTMAGDANGGTLNYKLFSDASHTTAWDDAALALATSDGTATQTMVYGTVPMGQNALVDTYSDTVTATVSF